MENAVISKAIAQENGITDEQRKLAGKKVFVYPETVGVSSNPKTVGVIAQDAKLLDFSDPNPDMMTCMLVEFIEMDEARKKYLGLV